MIVSSLLFLGVFEAARAHAPCVLFVDELDALGRKRSQLNSSAMRTLGNQLLSELDGVDATNEGVFVLAAVHPHWRAHELLAPSEYRAGVPRGLGTPSRIGSHVRQRNWLPQVELLGAGRKRPPGRKSPTVVPTPRAP